MSGASRGLLALAAGLALAVTGATVAGLGRATQTIGQEAARDSGGGGGLGQPEFVPADAALPRLRWPDGSLSVNDRCPVTKTRLARDIAPLFVNGRPVGFC